MAFCFTMGIGLICKSPHQIALSYKIPHTKKTVKPIKSKSVAAKFNLLSIFAHIN